MSHIVIVLVVQQEDASNNLTQKHNQSKGKNEITKAGL